MNQLIATVLLLFPFFVIAQNSDYVITNEDMTIYGTISTPNLSINASSITLKDKKGKESSYTPSQVSEWRKDGLIYKTKQYPFKRKETVATFMLVLSETALGVNVYEYSSRFNPKRNTDLFLERGGKLTKVRFGRFRKQMTEYFKDHSEITQLINDKEVKKGDLLALVEEYNETLVDDVKYDATPFALTRKTKKRVWNFSDMLLSTDEAAKKYMMAIKEATKDILDKKIQAIEIDYGVGLSFFEQKK